MQFAGVVEVADVAGDEPAVRARAAAAVRPVPGEQRGAADDDPADLAGVGSVGDEVEGVVRSGSCDPAGSGPSGGVTSWPSGPMTRSSIPASGRPTEPWCGAAGAQRAGHDGRRLRQSVALPDRLSHQCLHLGEIVRLERRGARGEQPDRGQRPVGTADRDQVVIETRRAGDQGDPVLVRGLEGRFGGPRGRPRRRRRPGRNRRARRPRHVRGVEADLRHHGGAADQGRAAGRRPPSRPGGTSATPAAPGRGRAAGGCRARRSPRPRPAPRGATASPRDPRGPGPAGSDPRRRRSPPAGRRPARRSTSDCRSRGGQRRSAVRGPCRPRSRRCAPTRSAKAPVSPRDGPIGTAIRPARATANRASARSAPVGSAITTRSPGATPSDRAARPPRHRPPRRVLPRCGCRSVSITAGRSGCRGATPRSRSATLVPG